MARADYETLGLLDRWREFMWEDQWRFNQVLGAGVRLNPENQNRVYLQYEREYIARALSEGIRKAAEYLGYFPAPAWVEDESVTINSDLPWGAQTLSAAYGHFVEVGRRTISLIESDVTVTYTGSPINTATITVNNVGNIAADEIQAFFRVADGAVDAGHQYWQIEPLRVRKSGSQATLTGHPSLFVQPSLWAQEFVSDTSQQKVAGDTADSNDRVTKVDLYRVYADATDAVQLVARGETVSVSMDMINPEFSSFCLYADSGQSSPSERPRTVKISYRSGFALNDGRMDAEFAEAIIRYANTIMAQTPPINDRGMAMFKEDGELAKLTNAEGWRLRPPFGVTEGGMFAWTVVEARRNAMKGREVVRR